jgi:hypothetical protein
MRRGAGRGCPARPEQGSVIPRISPSAIGDVGVYWAPCISRAEAVAGHNEETMRAIAITIALIGAGIAAPAAIAQQVPNLDVGPSCEAAARGAIIIGRDKQACLGDENAAKDTLQKSWSKYNSADKTQCVGLARQGGPPSYVELLSCLEVMRDSKTIRSNGPLLSAPREASATSPSAGGPRGRRRSRQSQPTVLPSAAPAAPTDTPVSPPQ